MHLKSLELFGFKSFAPRTILNFDRGVTCVVGPNGCGKSNVLDAIRWVLGEQSAKALRGGEMADVIFSGTDSRPGVGMAEVSLTFTECEEALGLDWHEVKLTRRVFRDGGSEYALNGTPCRLKDIHQLFMDTGIGRTAYSIMEQGKIDQILSSRPEDRRAIFEEAAGITKYKSQKKEALRKLEATDANLLRLQDIVKEVKRQIGSLQRQAGKARRYQAMIGDLKLLETHAAHRAWSDLTAQLESARGSLAEIADRQFMAEQDVEMQEAEVVARRAALDELEQRLTASRQAVGELRSRISNHESRIHFNEERVSEFSGLAERYRAEIAANEEKSRITEMQLRDTDSQLEQITEMLAGELRRMEEKQAATAALTGQRQEAERAIQAVAAEQQRIEQRVSSLRGQTVSLAQARDGAEARLAILMGDLQQMEFTFSRANEQLTSVQNELNQAARDLDENSALLNVAEAQLRESQAALGPLDNELRVVQRTLAERESRLDVLRQLNAAGEGFSEGTQSVMRGLDNPDFFKPAVAGPLAQFIEVRPEYVAATEAAFRGALQAIVMKDATVAEHVAKTLSAKKWGRAALVLRELAPTPEHVILDGTPLPEGALGWLSQKIHIAPEVAPLVKHLIGDYVLVEKIEDALRMFPHCRGLHFVTLGGELLLHNGILHAGVEAGESASSMLQRNNEIAALESEVGRICDQAADISRRREEAVAAIEAGQLRIEELREEKQNTSLLVSTLRNQLQTLEREKGEAEKKTQTLDWEKTNAEQRHQEAVTRLLSLEAEIATALSQIEEQNVRRTQALGELESVRAQENELAGELNELKIKVATERQRHSSLHHQRVPMEARLAELADIVGQRQSEISTYEDRMAATHAENAELTMNLEGLRGRVGESESEVRAQVEERAALAASVEEVSESLRALRSRLSECHEQRSRVEVRMNQFEMKSTALAEHIQKRYQLDLSEFEPDSHGLRVAVRDHEKRRSRYTGGDDAEAPASDETTAPEASDEPSAVDGFSINWSAVESMVRELDQRLEGIGPVNLDAIAEYEELEQRHTFLEQQNTDLINAKTELLDTIQKINVTTRSLFAETFEKIRTNFQEMFTELFGGGKANLILSDESDPLESGIEIVAKPPGKQLSNITLLSGGEKTMTAVSLLFSIYMVKPSPFCVLDEMDAPLDESNINRFIKILDRFVDQSQFLVISHNKRTIARADAIYGVTMEEHGVSKPVSVRFNQRSASQQSSDILGNSNPTPIPSVAESFGKHGNLASEQAAG